MALDNRETRIAQALTTLINEFAAPYLASLVEPRQCPQVLEADLTKTQAAKLLNVSIRTVEREIAAGHIMAVGKGAKVRIAREEVERYRAWKAKTT